MRDSSVELTSELRIKILKRDKYICKLGAGVGCFGMLNVHHITYRSRWKNDIGFDINDECNLITLCDFHHKYVHAKNIDEEYLRSLANKKSKFGE